MMTSLQSKTVLITGASGGLGTHVTRAFLEAGAGLVIGVARSPRNEFPDRAAFRPLAADLGSMEGVRDLFAKAGPVDVLVHLVGGFAGGMTVDATSESTLEQMLEMNLKSAFRVISGVLPGMRERGSGSILAIGTRAAVAPKAAIGVYAASKAALVNLVQTVAIENAGSGVTANIVLPGTMDTPANRAAMPDADPSQWVDPADVAALLVQLSMNRAVNGAVIPIAGREV